MSIQLLQFAALIIFTQASFYAQTKTCDLKLAVFAVQQTEYPLSTPLKNAVATLVNLSDNKGTAARAINESPFFPALSEG